MKSSLRLNIGLVLSSVLLLLVSSANFSPPLNAATMTVPQTAVSALSVPNAQTYSPGVHHLRGVVTRINKNKLKVQTDGGVVTIDIKQKALHVVGKSNATIRDVKKGDLLQGIVRVKPNGKIQARRLTVFQSLDDAPEAAVESATATEAANAQWSAPDDIHGTLGAEVNPTLAIDAQNNLYAVWRAYNPAGLWLRTKKDAGWTTPQPISGADNTAASPSLGVDAQGVLHLVWQMSNGSRVQIFYSRGVWNVATSTYDWTTPTEISTVGIGTTNNAYDPNLVLSNGTITIVHVAWNESYCVGMNPCTDRVIYRSWQAVSGWSAPVVIVEDAQFAGYSSIASDSTGRVGVAYTKHRVCQCYDAQITYRECASGNVNCGNVNLWSAPLIISPGTAFVPHLIFDPLGNANVVWQGFLSGQRSIYYSRRVGAGATWTAAESLATLGFSNGIPAYVRIVIGSLDNRIVVWRSPDGQPQPPRAYYREWNGVGWSPAAMVADRLASHDFRWGSLQMDADNAAHLLWRGGANEMLYSTTGSLSVSASLISLQVTDSANNIVTSFETNNEGWYAQNPITVTVTVTNPNATPIDARIPISITSPSNTTRFYVWSRSTSELDCQENAYWHNLNPNSYTGYTMDCNLILNANETRQLTWGLWGQPSRAGQFNLSAQMLAGILSASDQKTLPVELAQIHPFALIPGFGGTQQFGTDKFYEPLLETLRRMGYENDKTLFTDLTYNPLQSVVTTGEQLAAKMEEWQTKASQVGWVYQDQNGQIPIDLLGHSLGVPVIRSYAQLTPLGDFKPISRLLLVGGPNKGTPVTYLAREGLYAGGFFSLLIGPGLAYKSIECGIYDPLTSILPTDEQKYRTLHTYECGLHSIPELLPTSEVGNPPYLKDRSDSVYPYPVPPGSPNGRQHNPLLESAPADLVNDPWWLPDNPNPNTSYYALNSTVQQDLGDRGISLNQIHIFYNDALPTDQTYIVDSPNPNSLLWRNGVWSTQAVDKLNPATGDDTIARISAEADDLWMGQHMRHPLFIDETPRRDEKHTNLPVYPESQQEIGLTLSGNKPPFTTPLGLLNNIVQQESSAPTESLQNNRILVIYGIGNIELFLTDPSGKKIGFDPVTGQLIDEIPNALYFQPEGKPAEIVVFAPSSGNYIVLANGITSGEYKLLPLLTRTQETIPLFYQTGIIQGGETISATVTVP